MSPGSPARVQPALPVLAAELPVVLVGSLDTVAERALGFPAGIVPKLGDIGPEVLKIKGLYLGMNMDEAAELFKEYITPEFAKKLGEGEPLEVTPIRPSEKCNYGFGYFPQGCPQIFLRSDCSEDKKVYYIYIHNDIADIMFDAEGLNQEEFVKAFERSHNITMKLKGQPYWGSGASSKSWEFESLHGYKVTINQGHTITIEQVPKKSR